MKEYKIKINGNDYQVVVGDIEDGVANITVNGMEYTAELKGTASKPKTPKMVQQPTVMSTDYHPSTARTVAPAPAPPAGAGSSIKSPLPGVLLDVNVREGDKVKVGQKLMVLEAMKMENNIDSDIEGTVKSIVKQKGDSVLEGDVLITFE